MASSNYVCHVCKFGSIFYRNTNRQENWIKCEQCNLAVHLFCARGADTPVLCNCSVDSIVKASEFLADYQKYSKYKKLENISFENISRHAKSIPHVMRWTSKDIAVFFEVLGYENEAEILRKQNVDGQKALLLTLSDLKELGLKCGPAVKIDKLLRILRWKVMSSPMRY